MSGQCAATSHDLAMVQLQIVHFAQLCRENRATRTATQSRAARHKSWRMTSLQVTGRMNARIATHAMRDEHSSKASRTKARAMHLAIKRFRASSCAGTCYK